MELHTGRQWRSHGDTDVGIVRSKANSAHEWLDADWDLWVASVERLTPWAGEALLADQSQNSVWARRPSDPFCSLDICVEAGDADGRAYRRDPTTQRPWDEAVLRTADGIPYLAPDLQLLFRSKDPRHKDDQDLGEVMEDLSEQQVEFVAFHLPNDHAWRSLLTRP